MKLAVFTYNFPHKKTQDFLFKLLVSGYKPELVIASESVKLNLPSTVLRVKPKHIDLVHPKEICQRFNINYIVKNHNDLEVAKLLRKNEIDVGIIAGARILKRYIIETAKKGIINFHPAYSLEIGGLNALKWSIYYDCPLGVRAHFIDERIDAGRVIKREKIPVYQDDTFIDLSLRLEEKQTDMLVKVLERVKKKNLEDFPKVALAIRKCGPVIPQNIEKSIIDKFAEYKQKNAISRFKKTI